MRGVYGPQPCCRLEHTISKTLTLTSLSTATTVSIVNISGIELDAAQKLGYYPQDRKYGRRNQNSPAAVAAAVFSERAMRMREQLFVNESREPTFALHAAVPQARLPRRSPLVDTHLHYSTRVESVEKPCQSLLGYLGSAVAACGAGITLGIQGLSSYLPFGVGYGGADGDQMVPISAKAVHGKQVFTDYTIVGIPGDGRCMFRAVAYGASLLRGEVPPSGIRQRQLADELRLLTVREFRKRRAETEWFIEGDFDAYMEKMKQPQTWGGEPELFMLSLVLELPIHVYINESSTNSGIICVAQYGDEHLKAHPTPIQLFWTGAGHYDAIHVVK